jgi:hypothetical protein
VPLHNLSPLGAWEIVLRGKSTSGAAIDAIEDVMIDLHLTAL